MPGPDPVGRERALAQRAGARTAAIASQSFLHGFTVAMWIATAAVAAALLIALALARTRGGLAVVGGRPSGSGLAASGLVEGSFVAAGGLADAERALRMPAGGTSLSQHPGPVPRQVRGAPPPGPPSAADGDRAGSGIGSTSATGGPAQGRPARKGGVS